MVFITAILIGLGAVGYWGVSTALRQEPKLCQVCARPIHPGQDFMVELNDGSFEHTCCPRCGIHFQMINPNKVRAIRATDFATGAHIDARSAYYVEGSRLMTCCSTAPLKREYERVSQLVWDRCLPSLVAFKTESEAKQFQQKYGGWILAYAEAMTSVRNQ
jgi:nitrous oxide reductase accessory protein NosL